jgi:putative redox protein
MDTMTIVVRGGAGELRQDVQAGRHHLIVDEPVDAGGSDAGPTPYDLLLAALGACTAMTLRIYARRKGWPLNDVEVRLRHDRIHARDCADCETKEGRLDRVHREILLLGPLDESQRARLLEIANRCPVHRTLDSEIHVSTRLV